MIPKFQRKYAEKLFFVDKSGIAWMWINEWEAFLRAFKKALVTETSANLKFNDFLMFLC